MPERELLRRLCRSTGTTVVLVDRGEEDDEDNRWETICVDHGGVCSHSSRKLATSFLSHPDEWCEDCMYGPGTLDGTSRCACGSESLFDTDSEPGHEGEFVTVCLDCGAIQTAKEVPA